MKNILLFLIVFLSLWLSSQKAAAGDIILELTSQKYDSVRLILIQDSEAYHICHGKSNDKTKWTFSYPDSITDKCLYGYFSVVSNNEVDHRISFLSTYQTDTIETISMPITNETVYLKGEYSTRYLEKDKLFFKHGTDSFYYKDYLVDKFSLSHCYDEYNVQIEYRQNYNLYRIKNDEQLYGSLLDDLSSFIQKHPDSHVLISNLFQTLGKFQHTSDVLRLYNCFSPASKESYFGNKIQRYLSLNSFKNDTLFNSQTSQKELIIRNNQKYNLIVFSASWCGPCHTQIPILKEIYSDLKDKLDITYISIDKEADITAWNTLMEKEQIPWRSLLAKEQWETLREYYFIPAIPYALFVYPDAQMKVMDVRKKEDKEKLYATINTDL